MKLFYTTICILTLVLLSCGTVTTAPEQTASGLLLTPPIPSDNGCAWTDPVKIAGDGTGTFAYIPLISPSAGCDICDAAPLKWFKVEIIDLDPFEYEMTFHNAPIDVPMFVECDCGMVSIIILPNFGSSSGYAVGDTWQFGLE